MVKQEIIPPEDKIDSWVYRRKIGEYSSLKELARRITQEENIPLLDLTLFPDVSYNEIEGKPISEKSIPYLLNKVMIQKPTDNPNDHLFVLAMDYGYLGKNITKKIVSINKKYPSQSKPKGKVIFSLYNENKIKIAEVPFLHSSSFQGHPVSSAPQIFLCFLPNLEENQKFYYQIIGYSNGNTIICGSKLLSFKNYRNSSSEPFFFVAASDLHAGAGARFKRGRVWGLFPRNNKHLMKLMNNIAENESTYSFDHGYNAFMTSGDNIDNGSYHEYWEDFLDCSSIVLSKIPIYPTIGNHDYLFGGIFRGTYLSSWKKTQKSFHALFHVPRTSPKGAFYAHSNGNVKFIHLDSMGLNWGNESIYCGSRQYEWVKYQLKEWRRNQKKNEEEPDFCVVFLHSAILTIGFFGRTQGKSSDALANKSLIPLFNTYDVNLAVFGHDHMYQRSEVDKTSYCCIGLSGKTPINYFDFLRNVVGYKIHRDEEGEIARGYAVIYVPPKVKNQTEEQKREFDNFLESVRKKAMENIELYYYFSKKEKRKNKELFTDKDKLSEFVKNKIIAKLKDHLWWRFYNLKGELVDSCFIQKTTGNYDDIEKIQCPGEHIR
ncbi:MAG: metallophosphoesterase [Candidatus Heimdallarchaeum aukensis]|uniref:Metallophosphoesterase n=1 Tax=Candidatus Heimdallarchaeum aukensis TaxID=2876573 RepID=A0A9Y1BLF3_9ARCH|nr:MAG: metallophosphoesterase [Candidatus Heimdallarchaeum aukensis]